MEGVMSLADAKQYYNPYQKWLNILVDLAASRMPLIEAVIDEDTKTATFTKTIPESVAAQLGKPAVQTWSWTYAIPDTWADDCVNDDEVINKCRAMCKAITSEMTLGLYENIQ